MCAVCGGCKYYIKHRPVHPQDLPSSTLLASLKTNITSSLHLPLDSSLAITTPSHSSLPSTLLEFEVMLSTSIIIAGLTTSSTSSTIVQVLLTAREEGLMWSCLDRLMKSVTYLNINSQT